MTTTCL